MSKNELESPDEHILWVHDHLDESEQPAPNLRKLLETPTVWEKTPVASALPETSLEAFVDDIIAEMQGTEAHQLISVQEDIAEIIARYMKSEQLTPAQFCERVNCSLAYLRQILRGTLDWRLGTLVQMAFRLNRTVKIELIETSDEPVTASIAPPTREEWDALRYPVLIDPVEEAAGGGWYVWHPLLGQATCCADGDTLEEALANLETYRRDVYDVLVESGRPIPLP